MNDRSVPRRRPVKCRKFAQIASARLRRTASNDTGQAVLLKAKPGRVSPGKPRPSRSPDQTAAGCIDPHSRQRCAARGRVRSTPHRFGTIGQASDPAGQATSPTAPPAEQEGAMPQSELVIDQPVHVSADERCLLLHLAKANSAIPQDRANTARSERKIRLTGMFLLFRPRPVAGSRGYRHRLPTCRASRDGPAGKQDEPDDSDFGQPARHDRETPASGAINKILIRLYIFSLEAALNAGLCPARSHFRHSICPPAKTPQAPAEIKSGHVDGRHVQIKWKKG